MRIATLARFALLITFASTACAGPAADAPPASPAPADAPPPVDLAALRARLAPIASCATDESAELWRRVWCQGARLGSEPLPEPPPSPALVPLIGLSFGLPRDGDLTPILSERVPLLAVLLLGATSARVVRLAPENEAEQQDIEGLLFAVVTLLAGEHGRSEGRLLLPDTLRGFVAELTGQPAAALNWGAEVATFQGAMRSVLVIVRGTDRHDLVVTVEEADDGLFVSLFPFVPVGT